jgi:D-alanine-D-alanine ligase
VDFIVDDAGDRWMLEINTMPGFTDHSLLPKAAARAGMSMAVLCDRLVRSALQTR